MSTSATHAEPVPVADADGSSPPELAFLIGVPLAWAVLLLFHPTGEGESIT